MREQYKQAGLSQGAEKQSSLISTPSRLLRERPRTDRTGPSVKESTESKLPSRPAVEIRVQALEGKGKCSYHYYESDFRQFAGAYIGWCWVRELNWRSSTPKYEEAHYDAPVLIDVSATSPLVSDTVRRNSTLVRINGGYFYRRMYDHDPGEAAFCALCLPTFRQSLREIWPDKPWPAQMTEEDILWWFGSYRSSTGGLLMHEFRNPDRGLREGYCDVR